MADSVVSRLTALSERSPVPLSWRIRPLAGPFSPGIHRSGSTAILVSHGGVALTVDARGRATLTPEPPDVFDVDQWHAAAAMLWHLLNDRLVLHGSAVTDGSHAVAVLGASGVGKSTTAAYLTEREMGLLADDVTVLEKVAGVPAVRPQEGHVRLLTEDGTKRVVPVTGDQSPQGSVRLAALVVLTKDESATTVSFERLRHVGALDALRYHGGGDRGLQVLGPTRYFEWLAELADRSSVWQVRRPAHTDSLPEVAEFVVGLLREAASANCSGQG